MSVTIAIVQMRPALLDVTGNIRRAASLLETVRADVALLPELFTSGYTFATRDEARSASLAADDPFLRPLYELSRKRSMGICGGYAEREGRRLFNSSFFIGDGRLLGNYRKTHLFSHEKEFFSPGNTGFSVFAYKRARFGMMICFDWFYPEAARTLSLRGADVILHPANLVLPWCQRAMFARAVENRVYIATANRVGAEENGGRKNAFTGGSVVVSPAGEYLVSLGPRREECRTVEIDPRLARDKSVTPLNDLFADRRPRLYR